MFAGEWVKKDNSIDGMEILQGRLMSVFQEVQSSLPDFSDNSDHGGHPNDMILTNRYATSTSHSLSASDLLSCQDPLSDKDLEKLSESIQKCDSHTRNDPLCPQQPHKKYVPLVPNTSSAPSNRDVGATRKIAWAVKSSVAPQMEDIMKQRSLTTHLNHRSSDDVGDGLSSNLAFPVEEESAPPLRPPSSHAREAVSIVSNYFQSSPFTSHHRKSAQKLLNTPATLEMALSKLSTPYCSHKTFDDPSNRGGGDGGKTVSFEVSSSHKDGDASTSVLARLVEVQRGEYHDFRVKDVDLSTGAPLRKVKSARLIKSTSHNRTNGTVKSVRFASSGVSCNFPLAPNNVAPPPRPVTKSVGVSAAVADTKRNEDDNDGATSEDEAYKRAAIERVRRFRCLDATPTKRKDSDADSSSDDDDDY